jgi:hypothetical protein
MDLGEFEQNPGQGAFRNLFYKAIILFIKFLRKEPGKDRGAT